MKNLSQIPFLPWQEAETITCGALAVTPGGANPTKFRIDDAETERRGQSY